MCHCKTSCTLIQNEFSSINNLGQLFQQCLNRSRIRYQVVDDLCPGLVQALVPDACCEKLNRILESFASLPDVLGALVEHSLAEAGLYKIHLVYKTEDFGIGAALVEGANDIGVGDDVGCELARFDVEDEYEDGDGAKHVVPRLVQVVLDEAVLTAKDQFVLSSGLVADGLTLRSPRD